MNSPPRQWPAASSFDNPASAGLFVSELRFFAV
jgi:hypothetical protein